METKLERPHFNTKMVSELAKYVGEIMMKYSQYVDLESCIEDAEEILEWHWNDDGYELAKEFDGKFGYNIESKTVEELDDVAYKGMEILKQAVKKWVKEKEIKLELPVGATVTINSNKKNNEDGEIVKLYPETAQYGIWCESLEKPKGTSHYIIDAEKVTIK